MRPTASSIRPCVKRRVGAVRKLTAAAFLLVLLPGFAATLHVPAQFPTIQAAVDEAQPGDRILVAPGTYPERVNTVRDGAANKRIVLDGQGSATVHSANIRHQHFTLQNMIVSGNTQKYSWLVYLARGGHHAVITNCVVDAQGAERVYGINWQAPASKPFGTDAASNCLVISNRVTGILAITAINIMGDNNLITGNFVHDLGQADFVRLWGRNNIIRGNTFSNIFKVPGVGNHIDFIQTFGNNGFGSWGHVIEQNRVTKIEGGQLTQLEGNGMPEIGNWTFRNNLFTDIDLQASCSIPQVKYYHNVFYRCNTVNGGNALNFGSRSYAYATNRAHGARILNNVFLDCGDSSANSGYYAVGLELNDVVADHNFVAKNGYEPVRADSQEKEVGDPGGWEIFRWFEPNGQNGGNPGFVSELQGDFRLLSSSPLINAGALLQGAWVDIENNLRPQGSRPDIGAFEYAPGIMETTVQAPQNLRFVTQ